MISAHESEHMFSIAVKKLSKATKRLRRKKKRRGAVMYFCPFSCCLNKNKIMLAAHMGNMMAYTKAPKENTTICKRHAKEGCRYKSTSIHSATFPHHKRNSTN
jgi:hypothetical protein